MTDEQGKGATETGQAPPEDQPSTEQPTGEAAAQQPTEETTGSPEQRAEEYLRMAQRAQADLINYRRRVDQERDELRASARVDAVSTILPILDDFERAIS